MPIAMKGAAIALALLCLFQTAFALPVNLNITIAGGAAYTTSATVALALFADNTTASTNCSLSNDGSAWSNQTPYSTTASWGLAAGDGAKTVRYRCTDDGENWTSPVSSGIILDTAAPNITSVSPANGSVSASVRPAISVSVSEAGSGVNSSAITMTLDGSAVTAAYSSGTISYSPSSDLTETNHTVSLQVFDNAGFSSSTSWAFMVDKAPSIGSVSPPNGAYLKATSPAISATLSDSGTGINTARTVMNVDDVNVTGNTSYSSGTLTYSSALGEGYHKVNVRAYDQSGISASYTWNFTIDKTEPVFGAPAPPDKSQPNTVASISIGVTDSVSGVNASTLRMKLDSRDISLETGYSSGVFYYLPGKLAGGAHVVEVWADDKAGNSAYKTWTFSIFSQAPVVDTLAPGSGSVINDTKPVISAKVTDSGTSGLNLNTLKIYLDGNDVTSKANFDEGTRIISYSPPAALVGGNHTAEVDVSDKIGNAAVKQWSFIIDTIPPGRPMNLTISLSGTKADLSWAAPDGAASYSIYRSNSPVTSITGLAKYASATGTLYSDNAVSGRHYYAVAAIDAAGNQGEPAFIGTCAEYVNGWVEFTCCRDNDCSQGMSCNASSHTCSFPAGYVSKIDAENKLDDLRAAIADSERGGKNTSVASDLLSQSAAAYNAGNYSLAVNLSDQAISYLQTAPYVNVTDTGAAPKKKPFPGCGGSAFVLLGILAAGAYCGIPGRKA